MLATGTRVGPAISLDVDLDASEVTVWCKSDRV
jgi:hypothetical protein